MPNNILAEPVYRFSYRCAQNLCKGQIKAARDNMITCSNLGKDNPAKAKLLLYEALHDSVNDYLVINGNVTSSTSYLKIMFYFLKNFLKAYVSNDVRKADKEFKESYKSLYPNTHKIRDALIKQKKVTANNDTNALSRWVSFNFLNKSE